MLLFPYIEARRDARSTVSFIQSYMREKAQVKWLSLAGHGKQWAQSRLMLSADKLFRLLQMIS